MRTDCVGCLRVSQYRGTQHVYLMNYLRKCLTRLLWKTSYFCRKFLNYLLIVLTLTLLIVTGTQKKNSYQNQNCISLCYYYDHLVHSSDVQTCACDRSHSAGAVFKMKWNVKCVCVCVCVCECLSLNCCGWANNKFYSCSCTQHKLIISRRLSVGCFDLRTRKLF